MRLVHNAAMKTGLGMRRPHPRRDARIPGGYGHLSVHTSSGCAGNLPSNTARASRSRFQTRVFKCEHLRFTGASMMLSGGSRYRPWRDNLCLHPFVAHTPDAVGLKPSLGSQGNARLRGPEGTVYWKTIILSKGRSAAFLRQYRHEHA